MVADDDEIAALEARLAALKEKQAAAAVAAPEPVTTAEAAGATEEVAAAEAKLAELKGGFDMTTLSNRKRVAAIQDSAMPTELLSESWKEEDDDSGGGGGLVVGIGGVVAAVALLALSQVPVGSNGAPRAPAAHARPASAPIARVETEPPTHWRPHAPTTLAARRARRSPWLCAQI